MLSGLGRHQRVALGAERDGRLTALVPEAMGQTSTYEEYAATSASATVFADGTALVRSAASDMSPGTYTSMTQLSAETLGLPIEKVRFELGDSELPKAPVHGGSITMASVGNAVQAACQAVRANFIDRVRVVIVSSCSRAHARGVRSLPLPVRLRSDSREREERLDSFLNPSATYYR